MRDEHIGICIKVKRVSVGLRTISTSETGPKLVTKMSVLTSVTGPIAKESG